MHYIVAQIQDFRGGEPLMADSTSKVPGTVTGRFYVDTNCIDCDLCRQTAPDNFDRNEDEGFSFVKKQPQNEVEEKACRDALEECPVEAIGDDG
jgi:ferredoxin